MVSTEPVASPSSSPLGETIRRDLGQALKAKESLRVNTLRMLLAGIRNAEIEKRVALTNDDLLAVIRRAIKLRREAIDAAVKGQREDVRQREEQELAILEGYLPAQLGDQELGTLVAQAISEVGAKGPGDMGKVMKVLVPRLGGKADGGRISGMVRQKLSQNP